MEIKKSFLSALLLVMNMVFVDTASALNVAQASTTVSGPDTVSGPTVALASAVFKTGKDIITREEWGADESYLFLESNDSTPDLIQLDDDFKKTYSDEIKISRTVTHDSKGRAYKWPPEYPEKITKFIIHHTDTTSDLDNPKKAIRNIYYYHAVTRGWGDIGYNYILDPDGRVYEGRYGGEGVVGGHAGPGNIGSIGISILGDYENNEVPDDAIVSLARLIAIKAKIYNIDPTGHSMFRGKDLPNVMGHEDIMSTACPGDYLYEKLPLIASMAKNMMSDDDPKFVNNYDYIDKSNIFYLRMEPETTQKVTIKLENTGKITWDDKTFLTIIRRTDQFGVVEFPDKNGIKLAKMKESSVPPGSTATFTFSLKAKSKNELVYLDFAPVINGEKKLSDYKTLPFQVNVPIYTYKLISSTLPKEATKGEEYKGTLKLKNTGNIPWQKSGNNRVYIKLNDKEVGSLVEEEVKENGMGTFNISFTNSNDYGYYKGNFQVMLGNKITLTGSELKYETIIPKEGYAGKLQGVSQNNIFTKGKSYMAWIKVTNIGTETWDSADMSLGFVNDSSIRVKKQYFLKKSVKPGETVEINVVIEPAKNAKLVKDKPFVIIPKIKGQKMTNERVSIHYSIVEETSKIYASDPDKTVVDSELSQDKGGKIRVRISFNDFPIITGTKDFYLYGGDGNKIKQLKAGDKITLSTADGKYKATIDPKSTSDASTSKYSAATPFKVTAGTDGALEITNFDRDYNEFRGSLEFRLVDSTNATINELLLEDYLKGLAEEPNSEEYEKIKAIIVAARSYAKFYMHYAEKFPGKPYNLDDDPAHSQKYFGYGYEQKASNVVEAVNDTVGQVLTYNGKLIKAPYFSSDDGKTKSAFEVWGWDAPYLVSVDDPYCKGKPLSGHGVGMSGCGAHGMAENGSTYKEILKYYYKNIEITKIWQ